MTSRMILCFPPSVVVVFVCVFFCVRVCFVFSQGMPGRLELKEKAAYCGKLLSRQLSNQTDTTISITLGETNRRQCSRLIFPPKTNRASRFSFRPATPRTGQSDKRLWGWRDGGEGLHGDRPPHRGGSRVYSFISSMGTDLPTEGAAGFIHSSVPWGQTSPQRGQQGLFIHQFHGDRPPHRGGSRVYSFISSMGTDLPTEGTAGFIHSSVPWGQTSPQRGQQGLFIHQFHGDRPPHRGDSRVYSFISSMIYPNIHQF